MTTDVIKDFSNDIKTTIREEFHLEASVSTKEGVYATSPHFRFYTVTLPEGTDTEVVTEVDAYLDELGVLYSLK